MSQQSLQPGPSAEEVRAVKKIIASFLIGLKNYSLYPESHEICQRSLEGVQAHLEAFLEEYGSLRLDVAKDQLAFAGETVHTGEPREGNLPFVLFRDGIHWLEFQPGLTLEETTGFFRILNHYRVLQEDSEGDLVTTLWEADLQHVQYEADDGFPDSEAIMDFSRFSTVGEALNPGSPAGASGASGPGADDDESRLTEEQRAAVSIASETIEHDLWVITPEEVNNLRHMVHEVERPPGAGEILDLVDVVLMVIIREETAQEDSALILDFLQEEFRAILEQGDLESAYLFLENMYGLFMSFEINKPWAVSLLRQFFEEISGPECLGLLESIWPTLERTGGERLKVLRKFLVLLSPKAIDCLGPMLVRCKLPGIQSKLAEGIASLAARDLQPLERLLNHSDPVLVQKMLSILGRIKGEDLTPLLLKTVRHPDEAVRRDALKVLLEREPHLLKNLFAMIEDSSEAVRQYLLLKISRSRSREAESQLAEYLKRGRFKVKDRQHLLLCYEVLGRCGSSLSLPFLRDLLLKKPWVPGYRRALQRQGAARALAALEIDGARDVLDRASRSPFPNLRRACRKAREEM